MLIRRSLVFQENYGKDDAACIAKVKALYNDLKLEVFHFSPPTILVRLCS